MELHVGAGTALVYGLRNGEAGLYLSSGGGLLGGGAWPQIQNLARGLARAAGPLAASLPAADAPPLPEPGRVHFVVLTTTGPRAGQAGEAELQAGRGELLPLFKAGLDLIHGVQELQLQDAEPEPTDEAAYVNALLTCLARGTGAGVSLVEGQPLPDPGRLTENPRTRAWVERTGFALEHLDGGLVRRKLLDQAGLRWYLPWKKRGTLPVQLAEEDGTTRPVTFQVERAGGEVSVRVRR
jgi:hypothetical protein